MIQTNFIWFLFALHTFLTVNCSKYRFYKITAFNQRERRVLYAIYTKEKTINFLNGISNEAAIPIDVAVQEQYAHIFETKLQTYNIQYLYFTGNLMDTTQKLNITQEIDISNSFLEWDGITQWVDAQVKKNINVQKIVIAKTYERRDIFLLQISNGSKKPIVFIVGSEDGKDWVSSSVILNFLIKLLKDNDMDNSLLKYFDFYLAPIINPDGFVYSKIYDRFWSKNRKEFFPPISCLNGSLSVGVNIDRNWFQQKVSRLMEEECKNIYTGYEPLSEEETHTLSYVLNGLAINMIAFINLKGFSKFITIPYAHRKPTSNHDIVVSENNSFFLTKRIISMFFILSVVNRIVSITGLNFEHC
ncbi:zinc carboxypeptidase-like isoform X2 [Pieris napi]|uniref:zinc carboxypeptidase-like isoform X2 n=1 Tax=Pieris napi TaxID=78633 RepID=UPI001FBB270B|nr:zinc carboxypeptidase-like isoform X2 [Pieris napi]